MTDSQKDAAWVSPARSLLEVVAPPSPDDANTPGPLQIALDAPYSLDQWRTDLLALAAGSSTGFDVLDELGMRWLPGKMTAVIARPGAGKTAFLLETCARYLEAHPEGRAVFLSWEEPLADVVLRLLQRADARITAGLDGAPSAKPVPAEAIRAHGRGEVVAPEYAKRIDHAAVSVEALLRRLYLLDGDQFGRDVQQVLRDLATWMRLPGKGRVGIVCIDYFQKLRGADQAHSRQTELADVANTLRRFAKGATFAGDETLDPDAAQYAVPVIVGAQVNRSTLQSGDGTDHPTGDTIREADDLLNDAAAVISLSWEDAPETTDAETVRWLRLTVPKHRGGRSRGAIPGEPVARLLWRPARSWINTTAKRISAAPDSAIEWSSPAARVAPPDAGKKVSAPATRVMS